MSLSRRRPTLTARCPPPRSLTPRQLGERVVSRREGEAWARAKGMLFIEASAKTREGIEQVFDEVVDKVRVRTGCSHGS